MGEVEKHEVIARRVVLLDGELILDSANLVCWIGDSLFERSSIGL